MSLFRRTKSQSKLPTVQETRSSQRANAAPAEEVRREPTDGESARDGVLVAGFFFCSCPLSDADGEILLLVVCPFVAMLLCAHFDSTTTARDAFFLANGALLGYTFTHADQVVDYLNATLVDVPASWIDKAHARATLQLGELGIGGLSVAVLFSSAIALCRRS